MIRPSLLCLAMLAALSMPALARITPASPNAPTTLPIVPCTAGGDTGCVEINLTGALGALTPCWTLPPFGDAGVKVSHGFDPKARGRLRIEFAPLSAVRAGSYALPFGAPDATGVLDCSLALTVERKAGTLAPMARITLPEQRIWPFGREWGARTAVLPVGAAAGSVPVGPLALTAHVMIGGTRVDLPATLSDKGRLQPGTEAQVTLDLPDRFDLSLGLGKLEGEVVLTAPQLVTPLRVPVDMTVRLGVLTTFAVLVLGMIAGQLIRGGLMGQQALVDARILATRQEAATVKLLEAERDPELRAALAAELARARAAEPTAAAVEAASALLQKNTEALIAAATTARATMAEEIRPVQQAFALPIRGTELDLPEVTALGDLAARVDDLLTQRHVTAPRLALKDLAAAQDASARALMRFADEAAVTLQALAWPDLAALKALGPRFAEARAASLPELRKLWHEVRAAARTLPPLTALTTPEALALVARIKEAWPDRPIAAAEGLNSLARLYQAAGQELGTAGAGIEAGIVTLIAASDLTLPETAPSLEITNGLAVAGAAFDVTLTGGPLMGGQATILTPVNAIRVSPEGPGQTARFIADAPGPLQVVARIGDVTHRFTLQIGQGATAERLQSLIDRKKRLDRLALAVAVPLTALSGLWVFEQVPLLTWWALLAPLLWGFFANPNLTEAIKTLQTKRDALATEMKVT
jgi:hypothetical protein